MKPCILQTRRNLTQQPLDLLRRPPMLGNALNQLLCLSHQLVNRHPTRIHRVRKLQHRVAVAYQRLFDADDPHLLMVKGAGQ